RSRQGYAALRQARCLTEPQRREPRLYLPEQPPGLLQRLDPKLLVKFAPADLVPGKRSIKVADTLLQAHGGAMSGLAKVVVQQQLIDDPQGGLMLPGPLEFEGAALECIDVQGSHAAALEFDHVHEGFGVRHFQPLEKRSAPE